MKQLARYKPTILETALLVTLLLAAVAYWAPWVDHGAAALKLSGQDMGEFVKFIPDQGLAFPRQLFYIPPFACALCLVFLAANRLTSYPRWLRVIMLACAVLLLPGLLPPAWGHPKELLTPEFRWQGIGLVLGLLLVLGHGLLRRLRQRVLAVVVAGSAMSALVLPQVAFWTIRGRLWAVYETPTIHLGWGLWLHIAAWLGAVVGAWLIDSHKSTQEPDPG